MEEPKNPNIDPPLVEPNISAGPSVPEKPEAPQEIQPQVTPPPPPEPPKINKFLIIGVATLVLLVLGTGGYLAYQNYFVKKTPVSTEFPPTPTPDVTANWKTYTYDTFSIKLPSKWQTTQVKNPIQFLNYTPSATSSSEFNPAVDKGKLKVEIYEGESNLSLREYVDKQKGEPIEIKSYSETQTKVDNRETIKVKTSNPGFAYYVKNESKIYSLAFLLDFDNYNDLANQILSTFKFTNQASDNPVVTSPAANSKITSPLTIKGTVPASWTFEGVFPIKLVDADKKLIVQGQGKEKIAGSWQSGKAVEFTATLTFTTTAQSGFIILENDNPSGDPSKSQTFEVSVTF